MHYNVTSVDPPELVQFVKSMPEVCRDIPHDKIGKPITMWNLIVQKMMPPTRIARFCCQHLKESSGKGRLTVTGVRWAESPRRRKGHGIITEMTGNKQHNGLVLNDDNDEARRMVEQCYRTSKTLLNAIVDWSTEDVWEFLKYENVPYCGLYDEGFSRLGCIGCPMSTHQKQELELYPKYKEMYLKTFDRMLEERREHGKDDITQGKWTSAEGVYDWWIGKVKSPAKGQIVMDI